MKSSQIKFIRPKLLNNEVVSSWFSLRNQQMFNPQHDIPGLNLGLNTNEKEEVIFENRERLLSEIGLLAHQIAFAVQVHKTNVQYVEQGGTFPNTDAFVTDKRNLALAIQVADCAAILIADTHNNVIGAAHAGWRGAVGNIVPKTIEKMQELGAKTKDMSVFVSPCISLKNFEVGKEVANQFPEKFVDWERFEKPHVDMKGYVNHQLQSLGISENRIEMDESCTISDPSFYSYRRQKEKSGRMMGIIKLN
jgi:YfiH family protein